MRSIRTDRTAPLLVAFLVLAIIAFVLPTCLATACGMSMTSGMSLADLLACDSMYLPQDVPGAVLAAFIALFVAVVTMLMWAPVNVSGAVTVSGLADRGISDHGPPGGDSLFGKLRL